MSTDSLTSSCFSSPSSINLERLCSKAPQSWRKPRSRIYDYNRELGYEYYQPMIDYVIGKENQGVYHHSQRVQLPDTTDLVDRNASPESTGSTDLNDFLIKGYAKQIKERNSTTANVHYHSLHGSKANTDFSKDNLLAQHVPADTRRNYWLRELMVMNSDQFRLQREKETMEHARKEALDTKLAKEAHAKHMSDPEVVAWLRDGAKAATYWCHRTPLNKEERQARLEGKRYEEPEIDLKHVYYY